MDRVKIDPPKYNKLKKGDCVPIPKPDKMVKKKDWPTKAETLKKNLKKSKLQKRKDNSKGNYWKKKADKAWGEVVHLQNNHCAVNNWHCKGNLEAHHLISRSNILTRHKLINSILLCSHHHKFSVACSPHKGPIGFSIWLKKNRPEQFDFVEKNKYLTGEKVNYEETFNYLTETIEYLRSEK